MLSPRPPTGQQLNPMIQNRMKIRYDPRGKPMKRSMIGQAHIFQDLKIQKGVKTDVSTPAMINNTSPKMQTLKSRSQVKRNSGLAFIHK